MVLVVLRNNDYIIEEMVDEGLIDFVEAYADKWMGADIYRGKERWYLSIFEFPILHLEYSMGAYVDISVPLEKVPLVVERAVAEVVKKYWHIDEEDIRKAEALERSLPPMPARIVEVTSEGVAVEVEL